MVAFAAGSLLGGAFFHLLPSALTRFSRVDAVFLWLLGGFVVFFALEQFLHWRHCHRKVRDTKAPVGYLILYATSQLATLSTLYVPLPLPLSSV